MLVSLLIKAGIVVCVQVTVKTSVGRITGLTENVKFDGKEKSVTRFLGIPYAKPPTGDRRFARPEPYGVLDSTYNATFYRPHCMQSEKVNEFIKYFQMSEDCLQLNVFLPGKTLSPENTYPVMIFIHGGSFTYSGAEIFSGDIVSAFHDVIIVTVNYRLNSFGFLSNGTKSSGNFGLWDQKLALEWVHDYIKSFGGNPQEVTLFGNSAGAVSVLYQALHPSNKGLFKRIIAQSGSILAQWALQHHPKDLYDEFVTEVGCSFASYKRTLECLRSKPAEELVTFQFRPVIDGDFITEDPATLMSDESKRISYLTSVDFLTGVTSREGATIALDYGNLLKALELDIADGVPRQFFEDKFIQSMLIQMYGDSLTDVIIQAVIQQYTDWYHPNNQLVIRRNMVDFASDVIFTVPVINIANLHESKTPDVNMTFFYVFDHKPSLAPEPSWLDGAKHTMELPFVFGMSEAMKLAAGFPPGTKLEFPSSEISLATTIMTFWTNFAKSGNPNFPVKLDSVPYWPEYDNYLQRYIRIDANMTSQSVRHHFNAPRTAFWTRVAPLLETCGSLCAQKCGHKPVSQAGTKQLKIYWSILFLIATFVLK